MHQARQKRTFKRLTAGATSGAQDSENVETVGHRYLIRADSENHPAHNSKSRHSIATRPACWNVRNSGDEWKAGVAMRRNKSLRQGFQGAVSFPVPIRPTANHNEMLGVNSQECGWEDAPNVKQSRVNRVPSTNFMRTRTSIIHLLSGGLDSVTLLYDLVDSGFKVRCLMFNYSQRHVQELEFAKTHIHRLRVPSTTIELPRLGGLTEKDWVVPNRNAIFLALAVNMAVKEGARQVSIACNSDDAAMFPDCRPAFIKATNASIKAAGWNIEVVAPFLYVSKKQIVDIAKHYGVPLHEIWTCYRGGAKPCGKCPACKKLEAAICGR